MPTAKEEELYTQIAQYMDLRYPSAPYHFDLAGQQKPRSRDQLNGRGWPDFVIARDAGFQHADGPIHFNGLYLELKRDGEKLFKADGSYKDEHVADQAQVLEALRNEGFVAQFATGFDEAKEIIDSYMAGTVR